MRSIEPAVALRWADMAGELAGVGYWWMDASRQVIRWSPNMFRIFGISPEVVSSLDDAMRLIHPDDRRLADSNLENNLLGNSAPTVNRIVRPTGEIRHVEGRSACEFGPAGEVLGTYGTVHDVTDRYVAELALAESEARYRLLANVASDVVFRVSATGKIEYVSPSIQRYGWTPEGMIGKTAASFIHPEDVGRVLGGVIAEKHEPASLSAADHSYRMRKADGGYAWIEANSSLVREQDGSILAFVCQLRDVTERRAAIQALAESEVRYRAITENVSEVISRADIDGKLQYLSASIRDVTGYGADELIGASTARLIHPEDRAWVIDKYRQILAAEAPERVSLVYRSQHKAGHWISIEASPTVIRDSRGKAVEFLSVTRDVSARVKLENDLRAAADAAQAASATKSDFLANMSHEIRTPLTAILGFTGLLNQRTDLDIVAKAQLQRVSSASDALLSIVNDVLDFSKLESAHIEIRPEPTAALDLVNDVLAMFEAQTDAKGLRVAMQPEEGIPTCLLIDKARVRQILLNLIGNAVKFTERGLITVAVGYDEVSEQLAVDVSDTGPGLSDVDQAKLFQRFSQIDASSTRRHGGTGLGLAICRGLVEAMGGDIGVVSRPGQGSTFSFRIVAPPSAFSSETDASVTPSTLQGMRVLVADDNRNNRDLVRAMLLTVGAEVTDAADGTSAVSEATSMPFDVILMDIRMPGQDGPAALQQIRRLDGPNQFTPIIAFSADIEVDAFDRSAFDGFVRKPLAAADLFAGLTQCLSDAPAQSRAGDAAH